MRPAARRAVAVAALVAMALTVLAAVPVEARDLVGSRCAKAGATTGIPSGTLVCTKVGGKRVWKRMNAGGGAATPSAACPSDPSAVFTQAPVRATDLARITNGADTNDPRFAYAWVKAPYTPVPIFAPADGTLTTIRHLTRNAFFPSDDYQLVFTVPGDCGNVFRFNHVTDPRPDIRAAYGYGDQCSSCFDDTGTPTVRYEEREKPVKAVSVKAGELLGYTSGTPTAHDFDIVIQFRGATMCPMQALPDPARSSLMALLGPGPKSGSTATGPVPGTPCTGYGAPN